MEGPNTVDVSWLHHSHRTDQLLRTKSATSSIHENSSGVANAKPEPSGSAHETSPQNGPDHHQPKGDSSQVPNDTTKSESSSHNERSTPAKRAAESLSTLVVTPRTAPKVVPGRRNSWISSLSSKFSTGTTPPGQNTVSHLAPKASPPVKPDINPFGASFSPKDKDERLSDSSNSFASTSSSPKNPSFLSHAFRKFSSGTGGMAKSANNGGVCQRRIMNVDPNRDRCKVPELSQGKLKRVAFCVDVEIAGFASRADDEVTRREPTNIPTSQASKLKSKEKGEAGPLKSPDGSADLEKIQEQNPPGNDRSAPSGIAGSDAAAAAAAAAADNSAKEPTKKQEKKKRSEEERKERKERKRRQAEENGTIPMQFRPGEEEQSGASSTAVANGSRKTQSHPTTDPVRIYRRCCQLRETPVLKKLVEQMTSPSSTLVEAPGTVAVLDLTDFPMTLQDIMTLSDWLAIVPVRKLILENCALTDEGLRSILAGLLSTKTMQQARNRRRSTKENLASAPPLFGAVEKLSLKDNTKIGPEGWRHICLFIHLSKSLKAIDLSGIPFPKRVSEGVASPLKSGDLAATLASSMTTRFGGDYLEELLLSECQPSTEDIEKICDAAAAIKLRRLGLANNDITRDGLEHIVRYIRCGHCEGIDLGGNNLHESSLSLLSNAFDSENPLITLSLADCSLTPATIFPLLQACPILPNFRFIDFSHNPALFTSQPDCLSMLRKFLPRMSALKRIHLADVDLSPDHAIALAEVLPECPSLAHFNILENPRIAKLGSSSDPADQEEACAVYASLMAAARVSRTLIAVDIEVPGAESNEVVRALASQIVAYSLRNLGALEEISDSSQVSRSEVPIPEVLQHLVGYNGPVVAPTEDEPTPNEDYVIGGTGVVKALGVCLGNLDRQQAETSSGRTTPVQHIESPITKTKKARDMSKTLLGSARNIQARLQVALVREDRAGNDTNYRRLQFLDQTLQKIIQRFEEEFPECRVSADDETEETLSQRSSEASQDHAVTVDVSSAYVPDATAAEEEEADPFAIRLSRRGSNTSLHSRALTSEEGRLHRISQNIRRDFLNPSLIAPEDGGAVSGDDSHINAIREKLENLKEDEKMGTHVESVGADKAFHELGSTVEELWIIQQQDSDAFEQWKQSQIAAQINAGLRPAPGHNAGQSSTSPTGQGQIYDK